MDFERKNYFRPDRELLNSISEPDDDGLVQVLDTVGQDVNVGYLQPLSTPPSVLESHQIHIRLTGSIQSPFQYDNTLRCPYELVLGASRRVLATL